MKTRLRALRLALGLLAVSGCSGGGDPAAPRAVNGTVGAAIVVDPFQPNRLWLGTGSENDEIWRSDDCGASWTRVNTGPGSVGDQWQPSARTALLANDEAWSDLPAPRQTAQGNDGGIPFMACDPVHRILYASMFSGGVARMVIQ